MSRTIAPRVQSGRYKARGGGRQGEGSSCPRQENFFFFSNIVFDFAGVFLVAILVPNLYTGDPRECVRSLPPQTKNPGYGPDIAKLCTKNLVEIIINKFMSLFFSISFLFFSIVSYNQNESNHSDHLLENLTNQSEIERNVCGW